MSAALLQVLRAGDVEQLQGMLAAAPALARAPLYPACGCSAEPLLVACNGPFNGWPLGGRAAALAGALLDYAGHFGMVGCVDLLAACGARVDTLRKAAAVGLPGALEPLLAGADAQERLDALRVAVVCDRIGAVAALLATGIQINEDSGSGDTLLHWAAWEGKARMARYLVERGADPAAVDSEHGLTPAGWARHRAGELPSRWGHAEVLRVLGD